MKATKKELELIKLIDNAYRKESKWFQEGERLRAEYRKKFKKEP